MQHVQRGPVSKEEGQIQSDAALVANGWPTDNVTFLRSLPAARFVRNINNAINDSWTGSVDDCVLHELPGTLFDDPSISLNAEQIIVGFNSMDGTVASPWNIGVTPFTEREYRKLIGDYIHDDYVREQLVSHYYSPSNFTPYHFDNIALYSNVELAWWTMNGDVCVLCPTLQMAARISYSKIEDQQLYVYDFKGPGHDGSYYAPHGSEIPFVFDYGLRDGKHKWIDPVFFHIPFDDQLSDFMLSSWVRMAREGKPWSDWESFDVFDYNVLSIANVAAIGNERDFFNQYRDGVCPFWFNQVDEQIMKDICSDVKYGL